MVVFLLGIFLAQGPGNLILIGGGKRPAEAMQTFINCAGGPDAAIIIIPTASELPDTGMIYKRQFMTDYNCKNVKILNLATPDQAQNESKLQVLDKAGGIFFTGGDQRRIIHVFKDSIALQKLRAHFDRGGAIGGTSAGTACMSRLMLTGDGDFSRLRAGTTVLWPGLDFLGEVIVDQHFIARQRQNRLLSCILEYPQYLGLGVDEETAIWVKPNQTFEVLGDGWVQVYDAGKASLRRRDSGEHEHLSGTGLTLHVLQAGDHFDLKTRTVAGRGQ